MAYRQRNQSGLFGGFGGGGFGGFFGGGGGTATLPSPSVSPITGQFTNENVPGLSTKNPFGVGELYEGYYRQGSDLAAEENRRHDEALGFQRGEFDRFANAPAITDDEINQRFGMAAERAGSDANQAYSNLRQGLGDSGFFAGTGAGLASQIELARLGQLTGAARDLRLYKARLDSDKALQRLQASQAVTGLMNESPSMIQHDTLTNILGARLGQYQVDKGLEAAKKKAKSDKLGGLLGFGGQIIGGALSLFGG